MTGKGEKRKTPALNKDVKRDIVKRKFAHERKDRVNRQLRSLSEGSGPVEEPAAGMPSVIRERQRDRGFMIDDLNRRRILAGMRKLPRSIAHDFNPEVFEIGNAPPAGYEQLMDILDQ